MGVAGVADPLLLNCLLSFSFIRVRLGGKESESDQEQEEEVSVCPCRLLVAVLLPEQDQSLGPVLRRLRPPPGRPCSCAAAVAAAEGQTTSGGSQRVGGRCLEAKTFPEL